ncbi:hypothetical protein Pmani_033045, partial [Petrolisthes manimaculis]
MAARWVRGREEEGGYGGAISEESGSRNLSKKSICLLLRTPIIACIALSLQVLP